MVRLIFLGFVYFVLRVIKVKAKTSYLYFLFVFFDIFTCNLTIRDESSLLHYSRSLSRSSRNAPPQEDVKINKYALLSRLVRSWWLDISHFSDLFMRFLRTQTTSSNYYG